MKTRILSLILCLALLLGAISVFAACGKKNEEQNVTPGTDPGTDDPGTTPGNKPDALVVMTEELDGLFNPFYSTTANDANIVGMTQIGMITTGYKDGKVVEAYGDNEATVVKDYLKKYSAATDTTTYTFVIKNGIKFSDGMPLTMNDVMFNLYVYLDPAYAGSSTMYSIDIVGLQEYRTQQATSDSSGSGSAIAQTAAARAQNRITELVNAFRQIGATSTQGSYYATIAKMRDGLKNWNVSTGYKEAVAVESEWGNVTSANILADYEMVLQLFREELESDYNGATENFVEEPYKSWNIASDPVLSFMLLEGYVKLEYEKKADGKPNYNKIIKVEKNYNTETITTKEAAIEFVFNDKIQGSFDQVVTVWGTANKLLTDFTSKATEVLLKNNLTDGQLAIPNISGIVSLGHTTDTQSVTIGDKTYTVAHEHNSDGTVKNSDEYDVLQITVNGIDPKAIWSFAFAVAPQHYYAKNYTVDIANNKFGVEWASHDFMTKVIQASEITKVPMGAGAYKATNVNNEDNPAGNEFYSNNVVYFKANENFLLGTPKTAKLRYQVVSSSNALDALAAGSVHFVSPQLTDNNMSKIEALKSSGVKSVSTDQLGYGYIGINAGKVPDINIRKAIMTAMDTSRAISYYRSGTASTIYWPMSKVSWAYPTGDSEYVNDHDYPALQFNEATARERISSYMSAAGVSAGDSSLKITFTIAGSNLTEHPAYNVFLYAAEILNSMGWNIEVVADTQALTKLATGSLAVWAAAWGSTVDPDLYQVYHKNSTATSTLAWGYREILANPTKYSKENAIINQLSELIDQARETDNQSERTELYEEAMKKILDLAVELPVYQRSVLYAYNSNVIKESSLPASSEINPYSSPLDRIWEVELVG